MSPLLNYATAPRPHLHPLYAPGSDRPMTRFRPADHPWQTGVLVGLNDVDGLDFWCCGDPVYPPEQRGVITARSVTPDGADSLVVANAWTGPDGRAVAEETQRWLVHNVTPIGYDVDLHWEWRPAYDLRIGRYDYGGLSVRLVGTNATRRVVNANGQTGDDCFNAEATWTAVAQPVDGLGTYVVDAENPLAYAYAGVAVFDHPDNRYHPNRWRVGLEGMLNPAFQLGGPVDVAAGEALRARYRLHCFLGQGDPAEIDAAYKEWTSS